MTSTKPYKDGYNVFSVYVTGQHDVSMVDTQTARLSDDEMDAIIESKIYHTVDKGDSMYNTELHSDCYGDEYANEVINSIGFFKAHYGEM